MSPIFPIPGITETVCNPILVTAGMGLLGNITSVAIPFTAATGIIFFIWGISQYIMFNGEQGEEEFAKAHIGWSVAAFALTALLLITCYGLSAIPSTSLCDENTHLP